MNPIRFRAMRRRRPLGLLLLMILLLNTGLAGAAPVTVDARGRYLSYNGAAVPLIGMSGEFLSHVDRTAKASIHCTYANHASCVDRLQKHGLNKMQIWISLNSSVGIEDQNSSNWCTAKTPYTYEQPFFWNGNRWNLDRVEPSFFNRVNEVIAEAARYNIIVEVTLFANSGTYCTSPWYHTGRNVATNPEPDLFNVHFTDPKYFTALARNGATIFTDSDDPNNPNVLARQRQMTLVEWTVQRLNANPNMYYLIANEPDQEPGSSTATQIDAMVNWHYNVAKKIYDTETGLANRHPIGVNFWSQPALDRVAAGRLDPYVSIVNGHYVKLIPTGSTPNTPLYGAIPMLQTYWSAIPRVHGFNETKASPDPSLAGARAEAFEFMIGQGAIYDNYNLQRQSTDTTRILGYLNFLRQFLAPLTLTNFGRNAGSAAPPWVFSGLPAYPTAAAGGDGPGMGNTYFSGMQWTRNQHVLYIHHSSIPDPTGAVSRFKRYVPCRKSTGYQSSLNLALGSLSGWYYAEWFIPTDVGQGVTIQPTCRQNSYWDTVNRIPVTSPKYPYDVALRVMRCPNGVGPCTTDIPCPSTVAPLPPLSTEDQAAKESSCS